MDSTEELRRLAEKGDTLALVEYMKRKGYIEVTGKAENGDEILRLTAVGHAFAERHNLSLALGPDTTRN